MLYTSHLLLKDIVQVFFFLFFCDKYCGPFILMISYSDFSVSLHLMYSAYKKYSYPLMFSSSTASINRIMVNIFGVLTNNYKKNPLMP